MVTDGAVAGIHDVGDGGLAVALAELAIASSLGFTVRGVAGHAELFGEAPSRVVVCAADRTGADAVVDRCRAAGIPVRELGRVGGDRLVVEGLLDVGLTSVEAAFRGSIPTALAGVG
jgi:phosphoribosylformylglycinamidine synthase